jgi:anti-sigma factor ChrR (cupin superfamily)
METLNRADGLCVDLSAVASGAGVDWTPWREGIDIHRIYGTSVSGPSAALLRFAPQAMVPPHEHTGYEHVIVLAGSQEDSMGVYRAGTLVVNAPGTRHCVRAPQGCIVLVIWEQPVKLSEAVAPPIQQGSDRG